MQGGNLVTKIQIWNETENFTINGESCMYFNFHKGMPKINQVIGLKVKVRNRVTVSRAGLVLSTFSLVT